MYMEVWEVRKGFANCEMRLQRHIGLPLLMLQHRPDVCETGCLRRSSCAVQGGLSTFLHRLAILISFNCSHSNIYLKKHWHSPSCAWVEIVNRTSHCEQWKHHESPSCYCYSKQETKVVVTVANIILMPSAKGHEKMSVMIPRCELICSIQRFICCSCRGLKATYLPAPVKALTSDLSWRLDTVLVLLYNLLDSLTRPRLTL